MAEENGYVKWGVFRWCVGAVALAFVLLVGYMVTNDNKREADKDTLRNSIESFSNNLSIKLDTISTNVSDIKCEIGQRVSALEAKVK